MDKKFSEGFMNDIFDLLQMCVDAKSKECTITIPDPQIGVTLTVEMKFFVERSEAADGDK